jgi:hypothetical protein
LLDRIEIRRVRWQKDKKASCVIYEDKGLDTV